MLKPRLISRGIAAAALALASTFSAAPAAAALTIELLDGSSAVLDSCIDNTACDSNPLVGNVTLNSLNIRGYQFSATIGVSKPLAGSASEPSLQLSNLSLSGPGSGNLTILVGDTDFTGPLAPQPYLFSAGGTTSGATVLTAAYMDSGNGTLAMTTLLSQLGGFSGPSFSGNNYFDLVSGASPYSITLAALISPTSTNISLTGVNAQLAPVPLPGAALLLGSGLLGLFGASRRRPSR